MVPAHNETAHATLAVRVGAAVDLARRHASERTPPADRAVRFSAPGTHTASQMERDDAEYWWSLSPSECFLLALRLAQGLGVCTAEA